MTRGPRRLLEDPDFKWETGCDLSDEKLLVDNYDTDAMKQRLMAAVALGASGAAGSGGVTVGDGTPVVRAGFRWGAALKPIAGIVAAVGAVTLSFWAGMNVARTSDAEIAPPSSLEVPVALPAVAPTELPSMSEALPSEPAVPPVEPAADRDPQVARPPLASPEPTPIDPVAALPDVPALEGAPVDDGVADVASELGPVGALRSSAVPGQTAEYDVADAALRAGHFNEAKKRFGDYLVAWPDGHLASEAKLGLLEALHGLDDPAGVERYAAALAEDPSMSHLRHEILRLRAESLVKLDRCGEAVLVGEEVSVRTLADIRRACRQIRREEP